MAELTVDGLGELTSPAANDEIGIWDVSAGQYLKIRRDTLVGGVITGGGTVATGGFTLTVPATGPAAIVSEGVWTPQLKFNGTEIAGYASQTGKYIKLGNVVHAWCKITISSKGPGSGNAEITGLPFSVDASGAPVPGSVIASEVSYSGMLCFGASASSIVLYAVSEAGTVTLLTNTNFASSSTVHVSVTYAAA